MDDFYTPEELKAKTEREVNQIRKVIQCVQTRGEKLITCTQKHRKSVVKYGNAFNKFWHMFDHTGMDILLSRRWKRKLRLKDGKKKDEVILKVLSLEEFKQLTPFEKRDHPQVYDAKGYFALSENIKQKQIENYLNKKTDLAIIYQVNPTGSIIKGFQEVIITPIMVIIGDKENEFRDEEETE